MFSIPLIRGAHIGARALLVKGSKYFRLRVPGGDPGDGLDGGALPPHLHHPGGRLGRLRQLPQAARHINCQVRHVLSVNIFLAEQVTNILRGKNLVNRENLLQFLYKNSQAFPLFFYACKMFSFAKCLRTLRGLNFHWPEFALVFPLAAKNH